MGRFRVSKRFGWGLAATLLAFIGHSPAEAQLSFLPYGVFTLYSDFCYHEEAGDVLGTRVGFIPMIGDTYVFYQKGEGEPGPPTVVKLSNDLLKKGILDFNVEEDGRTWRITGTITRAAVLLTSGGNRQWLKDSDKVLRLPRVSLPQHQLPDCK